MKISILKKLTIIALIVTIATTVFVVPAGALNTTPNYNSSASTAGSWKSEPVYNIVSSFDQIYGGDVGTYFHAVNVGLSNAFVKSTSRKAYADLMEKDIFGTKVKSYTLTFGTYNGYYRPTGAVITTYTNSGIIESDNNAELYMDFKVETMSGDTSKNVVAGLFRYQFWAN